MISMRKKHFGMMTMATILWLNLMNKAYKDYHKTASS